MEKTIDILGASGHAKSVIDVVISAGYTIGTIKDADTSITSILNYTVNSKQVAETHPLLIAVGNNKTRKNLAIAHTAAFAPAMIHTTAVISPFATIRNGTVVMPGVIINAGSSIGEHCIINTGAVIEHDCVLENYSHISPNVALAGEVWVGEGTHIGIGACVLPGIQIGKWCTIGAGAVILKDVPDGATVVGNPGRIVSGH